MEMGFWYAGTETGDAQVSRLSCGGGGGGRTKKTVGGGISGGRRRGWGGFNK